MRASSSSPKPIVNGSSAEQPRPATANASDARARSRRRAGRAISDERDGEQERQDVVCRARRHPALDRGEDDAADRDHRPERGQRDAPPRRRGAELARHVELRPVAVDRLADAVEHGEAGVDPEAAWDARSARPPRGSGPPCAAAGRGSRPESATSRIADVSGRPHQKPSPTKIATNTGASAVPSPSRALRTSTDDSTPAGWKAAVSVFSDGTASPKPRRERPSRRAGAERRRTCPTRRTG